MKLIVTLWLTSALLISSAVQAQGLTRVEVKQQLTEAQADGLQYVTESSYPFVHPSFSHMVKVKVVAQPAQSGEGAEGDEGGVPAGSQESGRAPHGNPMPGGNPHCVGPVSFCDIYSGS
ncbi:uncharacterized protein DUF4148 [Paraburkholderia sp. BL6669N2]|uniref:DUF4148 domain-containing protein n=1 Tax=Paraburkholderia sp. BL6669N2 TaxID=1938807 RepID=UPI000E27F250|nr:DUF4148 domain-containing protein [Paraburkholderia sp. BL6669N2]REG51898.1 uncharacterized protein DUF4148 [Paraburkholderia sp. BL6669N2]